MLVQAFSMARIGNGKSPPKGKVILEEHVLYMHFIFLALNKYFLCIHERRNSPLAYLMFLQNCQSYGYVPTIECRLEQGAHEHSPF